jgi:GR25 family glycosyltransferase involved in LPS biosynthesis
VGEKWVGLGLDGKPRGHRHDQAILSMVSLRQGVARFPLDEVQCGESLRETFGSGRAIYIHRGNFQMHKRFATGIDEAYVINLDRRTDRMERLWANHPGLQGRVKRWSAVEGRALRLTPALEKLLRPNDFFWKKAVTGCALSHLGLWWKLATDHPDIQSYLVLEDDVKFNPAWEAAWQRAQAEGHVPDDYDILYLGGVLPPNRAGWTAVGRERVNDSFVRVAENTMWGQSAPTRYFHFCAYAYILSRQGVQRVIDLIEGQGGIWTSADHVLCNPVNILKAYVFDPVEGGMPAGCYQDDDPKYATAEFNNFSRIDSFDSDLWNNDERFSEEERAAAAAEGGDAEVDIGAALADARKVGVDVSVSIGGKTPATAAEELKRELKVEAAPAAEEAAAPAPATHPPPIQPPASETRPVRLLPRRIVCMNEKPIELSKLYEYEWLRYLFGNPSLMTVESILPTSPPPFDEPIVLVQRPYDPDVLASMLERWSTFGASFYVLHISDEAVEECYREPLTWYDVSGCKGVMRFYPREDLSGCKTPIYTLPLGYHWTLQGGSQNPLMKTPRLPFRETTWSFFGTGWRNRKALLQPLLSAEDLGQSRVKFFDEWKDPAALGEEEYIASLLDSIFVACPGGMNPETFRLYEALECGCVPLVVRTASNTQWLDWITKKIPLIAVPSWEAQVQFVRHLMTNKQLLEAYRENVLQGWIRWREELKRDVGVWLEGGATA